MPGKGVRLSPGTGICRGGSGAAVGLPWGSPGRWPGTASATPHAPAPAGKPRSAGPSAARAPVLPAGGLATLEGGGILSNRCAMSRARNRVTNNHLGAPQSLLLPAGINGAGRGAAAKVSEDSSIIELHEAISKINIGWLPCNSGKERVVSVETVASE